VLLLLDIGLLDHRAPSIYYAVNLQGAAREGERHGAWFNTSARANNYLDDADTMTAVNQSLAGPGLVGVHVKGNCLLPNDGNGYHSGPYPSG
jgi:hypothetical protein